jgi:uncharacterized repeat protein (TIGR03847 family)
MRMTRRIFSFDSPDRFVVGAVGQPGQRTFYLQAAKGAQVVSVALEKAQVAILAERLASLLLALRQGGVSIEEDVTAPPPQLDQPVIEQFRVGTLTLGWDGDRERIVIEAREMSEDDEEDDEDDGDDDDEGEGEADEGEETEEPMALGATDFEDGPDLVRVQLDATAALAFASGAVAVIQAGRPPCPQCGAPLNPTGHFCPRRNGYQN